MRCADNGLWKIRSPEAQVAKGENRFGASSRRCANTCQSMEKGRIFTPLKINMEHNHGGLEDHFPF